jgi:hypothetical protein
MLEDPGIILNEESARETITELSISATLNESCPA